MEIMAAEAIASALSDLDEDHVRADYVYMYPPRQAYRGFPPDVVGDLPEMVEASLAHSEQLNIYLHVPFCKQICSFCNLYTTRSGRDSNLRDYVEVLKKEALLYERLMDKKNVRTIYVGGGTPSLLDPQDIHELITTMKDVFADPAAPAPVEVAMEVAPETVDLSKLREFREAGINRINLGYQSMVPEEVSHFGRRRSASEARELLAQALEVGYSNVCVDLIYGLEFQTDKTWEASLGDVIDSAPATICAYCLTSRPHTGYQRHGYKGDDTEVLYRRYDIANQLLTAAGYTQETHVRWVKPGGGYLQKEYHWGMQNLLGLGAGARSYLWEIDTRNGYSINSRTSVLEQYVSKIENGHLGIVDGCVMTDDERARKAVVLGLIRLDRAWFHHMFGLDPLDVFQSEFRILREQDLCSVGPHDIKLTERGRKYRDVVVQLFFSETIRARTLSFDYDE